LDRIPEVGYFRKKVRQVLVYHGDGVNLPKRFVSRDNDYSEILIEKINQIYDTFFAHSP
jgi:hypothetical protein